MKTPQEIAADIYWTATDATTGPAIRALIVAGIEADRTQRADGIPSKGAALSALHEWAVRVSSYADREDLDALVEIEQRFGLVDEDGEPTT